jgi:hypothetical protein
MKECRSTPETVMATAHLNNMGRDEMNLAEFPLTTLADRAPHGCKTLVFEDRIWDRGHAQHRVRRLTISASDKYGLPTAIDDEVILGLVQVSKAAGFVDRRVRFSRYQLIHLLGWRDEGRSYRRLEHSLKRWLGVTLYYENAWWDKAQKRWVDAHFHLLDDLVLYHRPKPHAGVSAKAGDAALSFFTWNEMVFRSFQAGFLKQLDLDFYRRLKLAAAKRMYRFLDKRFHFSSTLRFNLPVFACEHIGLSRRYDAAQLKRRLSPAVAELEQAGYLVPLPAKDRFHRLRRGHWEVVFVRTPKPRRPRQPMSRVSDLESRLIERGVTASVAAQLVREHAADLIQGKVIVFDTLREKRDRRISQNPAGFLVQSIRMDYAPPAGLGNEAYYSSAYQTAGQKEHDERGLPAKVRIRSKVCHVETSPVEEYLSRLSASEREELEAKAIKQARRLPAEGYQRATTARNADLAQYYLLVMLEQYLRPLIGADAALANHRVTQESI